MFAHYYAGPVLDDRVLLAGAFAGFTQELDRLGYKIVVCPIESLLVAGAAVQRLIQVLLTRGRVDLPADEMMTFAQVKQVLGLEQVLGLRDRLGQS